MTQPRRLYLRELRWLADDRCGAAFEWERGETVETVFTAERRDGITGARPDPSVFDNFDGSAADLRAIIGAVVAFLDVAA